MEELLGKDKMAIHLFLMSELGAVCMWPNKDHMYDEVDNMLISVNVPANLTNVSNGRLQSVKP
jgi:hypothetical protein